MKKSRQLITKIISVALCPILIAFMFSACGSSTEMTEENVTKTVNKAVEALKEFDTDGLDKYVVSSTLTKISPYVEKYDQLQQLGAAIFENLEVEIKSIDLENKTVTLSVKNKDLTTAAESFASDLKDNYSALELLSMLSNSSFLDEKLSSIKKDIVNASTPDDGTEITVNVTEGDKNLMLDFDETAENAVSGGALSSITSVF